MPDDSASGDTGDPEPTMDEIIDGVQPMRDLGRFVIEDMTAEEEAAFFAVLDGS